MKYDLHSHSTYSDGALTPEQLIHRAKEKAVDVLALTDHDTTAGLAEAAQAAKQYQLQLINGIELSTRWKKHDIHIVGLNIDPGNNILQQAIDHQQQQRIVRGRQIGVQLAKQGIADAYAAACQIAGREEVGRPHFAQVLVQRGIVNSIRSAFKRYLIQGKPAYVATEWLSFNDTITCIKQAGGCAVLAHPARYHLTMTQLRLLLSDFKAADGQGIEVVSSAHNQQEIETMAELSVGHQLYASVGSDFHGPDLGWGELGHLRPLPSQCRPIWKLLHDANI